MMFRILCLWSFLFSSAVNAQQTKSILEAARDQAKAEVVRLNAEIESVSKQTTGYDACRVADLLAEADYNDWFIKHYSQFSALEQRVDQTIANANKKIGDLRTQQMAMNPVPGQDSSAKVDLNTMVEYFKDFNARLKSCSKDSRSALMAQQENPRLNRLHVAHSQVLDAMKQMTSSLNASLKESGTTYEIGFRETDCGYVIELRVKLEVDGMKLHYEFSLLDSTNSTVQISEAAKWENLTKGKMDGMPVDGLLRFHQFQAKAKDRCKDHDSIGAFRARIPYLTLDQAQKASKELAKAGPSIDWEFVQIDANSAKGIQEYEIQTTETTELQWALVMGAPHNRGIGCTTRAKLNGIEFCPHYPVDSIDTSTVNSFLTKLNETVNDGYVYRLPTAAEWEYAARAGTTGNVFFDTSKKLEDYAWLSGNVMHEVAQKLPNPWGLYDIYGNMLELVSDREGDNAIYRGGSYEDDANYANSTTKYVHADHGHNNFGFRLVRVLKQ